MVGGGDLVISGFGSGGGAIGDASLGMIAFLASLSTLEASSLAIGIGIALGLVLGTWRGLPG